jgi:hypothetical protein
VPILNIRVINPQYINYFSYWHICFEYQRASLFGVDRTEISNNLETPLNGKQSKKWNAIEKPDNCSTTRTAKRTWRGDDDRKIKLYRKGRPWEVRDNSKVSGRELNGKNYVFSDSRS